MVAEFYVYDTAPVAGAPFWLTIRIDPSNPRHPRTYFPRKKNNATTEVVARSRE